MRMSEHQCMFPPRIQANGLVRRKPSGIRDGKGGL